MLLYKMSYFPAPYTSSKGKIKVKLGLSNYATKLNSKSGTEQPPIHQNLLKSLI